MSSRIYAVSGPDTFRLVEANTKNAALRHVVKDLFVAEMANQKLLVAAMTDGVKVERVSLDAE